jgi:hypothetical protein
MENADIIKYLDSKGCKYLGTEQGIVFYKDKNGETQGASEYSIVRCMLLLEGE